jgi:hypothetical protein
MTPLLASDTPSWPEEEIVPALFIVHVAPVLPSTPSALEPVEVTVPVLVMERGLLAAFRATGPVVLVLIVLPTGGGGGGLVSV